MPDYTAEEIEERKRIGIRMNRLDNGWNIPPEMRSKIVLRIAKVIPRTDAEKRDKKILEMAFIQDICPQTMSRMKDEELVGMGNRSRGKQLSSNAIRDICYAFAPEVKEYRKCKKQNRRSDAATRIDLWKKRRAYGREKRCACCGNENAVELHHIIPVAKGGTNDEYNLIYMCHGCHMKLHHTIYDRLKWAIDNPA